MRTRWKRSFERSARGATLVEAVLGTAILGSLLVGIVVSAGRLEAERGRAARRIEACRAADALLEGWWQKGTDEFPRGASGEVPGRKGLRWRTSVGPNETAHDLRAEVVALELFAADGAPGAPLVRVELLLPEVPDEKEGGPDAG